MLAVVCGGACLFGVLTRAFILPTLDPNNTEYVEEGDFGEYQEEEPGQVADPGKPSNNAHIDPLWNLVPIYF